MNCRLKATVPIRQETGNNIIVAFLHAEQGAKPDYTIIP